MVKHIVIFKLKDSANGKTKAENIVELKEKLLELKNQISEVLEIEVGVKSDKASETNYDVILITKFDGFAELDIYRVHPEHVKVVTIISEIADSRVAIDYEM